MMYLPENDWIMGAGFLTTSHIAWELGDQRRGHGASGPTGEKLAASFTRACTLAPNQHTPRDHHCAVEESAPPRAVSASGKQLPASHSAEWLAKISPPRQVVSRLRVCLLLQDKVGGWERECGAWSEKLCMCASAVHSQGVKGEVLQERGRPARVMHCKTSINHACYRATERL